MNLHEILFASKFAKNSEFDFSEYVKNTDFATKEKVGLMRPGGGLDVRNTGVVEIASATNAEISAGTNNYKPIVLANLAGAMSIYGIKNKTQIDEMLSILNEIQNSKIPEISFKNSSTLGYSVKNLLKNSAKNKTINGVDFTVNSDNSVTANGTATDVVTFTIADSNAIKNLNLNLGEKYILSGCQNGSTETFDLRAYGLETSGKNIINHNGDTIFEFNNFENANISILIRAGVTVNNVQFFPMICGFYVADNTYETYKSSVEERLTALENAIYSTGSHCHYCIRPQFSAGNALNVSEISGIPNVLGIYDDGYSENAKNTAEISLKLNGKNYSGTLTEK